MHFYGLGKGLPQPDFVIRSMHARRIYAARTHRDVIENPAFGKQNFSPSDELMVSCVGVVL